ncbi:MAG: response regulator [Desulfobacterium sp.]|jgi:CheY-like chemotaxis protein|nr:response regulator [Desulfobacterium sp.]
MSVITLFSGSFCKDKEIQAALAAQTGYNLITEDGVVAKASSMSSIGESKIREAFREKTSIFNKFTHEKERSIACMRLAVAEMLARDNLIVTGFPVHLIPKSISHVLRVCSIAGVRYRVLQAEAAGISERDALTLIKENDKNSTAWVENLTGIKDPWDKNLYDIVIPMDTASLEEAVALIVQKSQSPAVAFSDLSTLAVGDFLLASRVETVLAGEGHNVEVLASAGEVTLTINKNVLMLKRLEEDLTAIVREVEGVKTVKTEIGKGFYQTDIYRKFDFEAPSKVLLVDDEREFVQTLSERLLMREMSSAVAYDGESALNIVDEDEPDVMILDLKMPGIDGIEVLKKVKATKPGIEVIILTGHGSETDKKVCMELGAFAYLQKPVDIDLLSKTLKLANEKIKQQKA